MPDDLLSRVPLKVHPVADLFPMLPEHELADLAADIKAHGLQFPIMLDAAGEVLVDGRNRLAACEIAKVEPRFERLTEGHDPVAFIWSTNLARRHLAKGQVAMLAAQMCLVSRQTVREAARLSGVSRARVGYADVVLQFAPDLVAGVMAGSPGLDEAYRIATSRKQEATGTEARIARLRDEAPEVADLVIEGTLSLAAGLAELDERERTKRNTIESGRRSAERIATSFAADAIAILSAIDLGAEIELEASQQTQIKQTLALLSKEGVLLI